jgi:type I restriction enzyme S subunit
MGLKTGYKKTDVGVIPKDWEVVPIGEAGHVVGGRQRSPNRAGDLCKYLRVANVFDGFIDATDVLEMPFLPAEKVRFRLEVGDILLNEGQSLELVGRSAIYRGFPEDCYFQNTLIRFRARYTTCPVFAQLIFQHYLRAGVFASIAMQTTSIAHLGTNRLAVLKMPLPPKAEQQSIADALGDADALTESLEELLTKKRRLKKGAMHDLLTGTKRLPGFNHKWRLLGFGEIAQPRKQRVDPRRSGIHDFCIELEHIEHGTGCLAGSTATGKASSLKSVFQKDDVLFGKLRAYLRKYWLADRDGVCSTEIWVLAADRSFVIPQFLFQIVKMDRFIEAASTAYGTHMPRSDWNVVKNYELQLPPTDEQGAIAAVLSDMDAEIAALESKLTKARRFKTGMMQELLTGRIRLI